MALKPHSMKFGFYYPNICVRVEVFLLSGGIFFLIWYCVRFMCVTTVLTVITGHIQTKFVFVTTWLL